MWQTFGCLIAYFVLVFAPHASAADFSVDRSDPKLAVISVSGELLPNDYKIFISKTLNLDAAIVIFYSNGGNLVSGLEIGKAIHLKDFQTYVPDNSLCASACALAWLGGNPRYLSRSASLGFHAAFLDLGGGVTTENGMANAMVGAYLNSLGLPTRAVTYMTSAAPDSMQWLTFDDAEKIGLNVMPFDLAPAKTSATNEPQPHNKPTTEVQTPQQAPSAEDRFWADLQREVPDWSQINNDNGFKSWLLEVDPLTGAARQSYLEQAQKQLDVNRVIAFFRAYAAATGKQPAPATPPPAQSQPARTDTKNNDKKPTTTINICRPGDTQVFANLNVTLGPSIGFVLKRKEMVSIVGVAEDVRLIIQQKSVFGQPDFFLDLTHTDRDFYIVIKFETMLSRPPKGGVLVGKYLTYWNLYVTTKAAFDLHCTAKRQKQFTYYSK